MENINLGYACINQHLSKKKVSVNRSCVAKTFREKGIDHVIPIVRQNLESVIKILEWNNDHNIHLYRMSSDMFPHITNPEFIKDEYAYPLEQFQEYFVRIGELADRYSQRLTFHPGQFNQVGSPHENVFEKTKRDLKFHADVLDMMNRDENSVMVVHGGGTYGDKEKTIERWCEQFKQLPTNVQQRLVFENCERAYSVYDALGVSKRLNIPVVFDTHHHDCFQKIYNVKLEIKDFMNDVLRTWRRRNIKPKFHISEQAPDKRIGAHSDYVERIPKFFFKIAKVYKIDIMIEAKEKERAVMRLLAQ